MTLDALDDVHIAGSWRRQRQQNTAVPQAGCDGVALGSEWGTTSGYELLRSSELVPRQTWGRSSGVLTVGLERRHLMPDQQGDQGGSRPELTPLADTGAYGECC